jgi:YbbR domain-containing protein
MRFFVDNLVWFLGSLVLAFIVWMVATVQSDPIQQQPFLGRIDVQMNPNPGLLITAPQDRTARVVVRAPKSVLDLLTAEEIEVWADLSALGPGSHTVELQARVARQATVVDISPRQMKIMLEEADSRQIPLRAVVVNEPPAGYSRDEPVFDINLNQVRVSGPASKVREVAAAQIELNLSQQRNPYAQDMRLTPVDADGRVVSDVILDPSLVHVSVNIRRRADVRDVSVRPTIVGKPPEGYVLNSLSYSPQSVLVSGSPEQLAKLPTILSTEPIDLATHTTSFEVSVPVVLPDTNLLLFAAQSVNVSVEIKPVTGSRQFDAIPVEIIGLPPNLSAKLAPNQVSVLVNGPQATLELLKPSDIRVAIDLNGLAEGNHTAAPTVSVDQGKIPSSGISVLPAEIDVEITRNQPATPRSGP